MSFLDGGIQMKQDSRFIQTAIYIAVFIVAWNMLDMLYTIIFTRQMYHFSFSRGLGVPVSAAILFSLLFVWRNHD